MAKCVYEIRKPDGWNITSTGKQVRAYKQTLKLNSFSEVKKFLSTKNYFTVGQKGDVFKNGELIFNVDAFEYCRVWEKLTLRSMMEYYNDNK
jgi:hypothetical protein